MLKKRSDFTANETNTVNIQGRILIEDVELLMQHFGHSRYVYNWCIDYNNDRYKNGQKALNAFDLIKLLPVLKKEKQTEFLKQVDASCLQQAIQDYWTNMQKFLSKKGGKPHYKSKHGKQSFRITNYRNRIRFSDDGKYLKLSKFGWVRIKLNQRIPKGTIQSVTIKQNKNGKIFATLTIRREEAIQPLPKTGKEVGIDIGVKHFATFSDGTIIERPEFILQDDKKKRRMQRKLSKKKYGSKNYRKMQHKLAKLSEKDVNRRNDFAHKLALQIVRDYDFIAVEHLNIQKMLMDKKYRRLHQMIGELGWYSLLSKIKYKSAWYGKQFVQVDTYFPSSQICSHCGYQNSDVKNLKVRDWVCPQCGTHHDRDSNAAMNILNEGKRMVA